MAAALGYFDSAAALSAGQTFTVPAAWMSQDVPAATLAQLAHSMAARFRAAVARTLLDRPSLLVVCGDEQGGAFSPPGVGPGNRPLESPRTLR
jgi:hypothetical protein